MNKFTKIIAGIIGLMMLPMTAFATITEFDGVGTSNGIMIMNGQALTPDSIVSVTSTGTYTVDSGFVSRVHVDVAGSVIIRLRSVVSAVDLYNGQEVCVFDTGGHAFLYNIVVDAEGTETVGGSTSYTIDENYGGGCFEADSDTGGWQLKNDFIGNTPSFKSIYMLNDMATSSYPLGETSIIIPSTQADAGYPLGMAVNMLDQAGSDLATAVSTGIVYNYAKQSAYTTTLNNMITFSDISSSGTTTALWFLAFGSGASGGQTGELVPLKFFNHYGTTQPTKSYILNAESEWLTNGMLNVKTDSDKYIPLSGSGTQISYVDESARTTGYLNIQAGSVATPMATDFIGAFGFTHYTTASSFGLASSLISAGMGASKSAAANAGLITTHASDDASSTMSAVSAYINSTAGNVGTTVAFNASQLGGATGFDYLLKSDKGADIEAYKQVNDGNPSWKLGANSGEQFEIQSVYDAGAQTLDYVAFKSYTADATGNEGLIRFYVDEAAIMAILDNGISIGTGFDYQINGASVLNATTLGSSVLASSLTSVGTLTSLGVTGTITQNAKVQQYTNTKTLSDGAATGFIDIPIATSTLNGGHIFYTIKVTDGTDLQSHSGSVVFNGINKAGTITSDIEETYAVIAESEALSAGTLSDDWTITNGADKITINTNANTSLAGATITMDYTLFLHSTSTITAL